MAFIMRSFWRAEPTSNKKIVFDVMPNDDPIELAARCEQVRQLLQADAKANPDTYDANDLFDFVASDNDLITRYLERREHDPSRTFEMMRDTLQWRKQRGLSSMNALSFPKEFYTIGSMFQYEYDVDGNAILMIRCKVYRGIIELKEGMELFTAYHMFEADKRGRHNNAGWALVFDLTGCGFPQYDVPMLSWLIKTLLAYYPVGLRRVSFNNVAKSAY